MCLLLAVQFAALVSQHQFAVLLQCLVQFVFQLAALFHQNQATAVLGFPVHFVA